MMSTLGANGLSRTILPKDADCDFNQYSRKKLTIFLAIWPLAAFRKLRNWYFATALPKLGTLTRQYRSPKFNSTPVPLCPKNAFWASLYKIKIYIDCLESRPEFYAYSSCVIFVGIFEDQIIKKMWGRVGDRKTAFLSTKLSKM